MILCSYKLIDISMLVPYVPNDMDKFFIAEPRKARGEAH